MNVKLQQYLPLAVLKPIKDVKTKALKIVATVLTACGIETEDFYNGMAYGSAYVATVLTACGIETPSSEDDLFLESGCNSTYRLRY